MKPMPMIWSAILILTLMLTGASAWSAPAQAAGAAAPALLPAFPGAEGFGAATPGGRGGKVFVVTTLEDYAKGEPSIPGSLREAVTASGPRIVVFAVGGTIALKDHLTIREPFLTIAGQTAPGGGICLRDKSVWILGTHDIVVRYLRVRPGRPAGVKNPENMDCIAVGHKSGESGSYNVIIDHCSATWGSDETISTTGVPTRDVTIQWSLLAECLTPHSMGSVLNAEPNGGISFHHNIYAHVGTRAPKVGYHITVDFRNNIIYDWGGTPGYGGNTPSKFNYIGNYIKPGPSTREDTRTVSFMPEDPGMRIYLTDNFFVGLPDRTADNRLLLDLRRMKDKPARVDDLLVDKPFPCPAVSTAPPEKVFQALLDGCGAILPKRDETDRRIMEEIRTGGGRILDTQEQVGGWPKLEAGAAPADADRDGMPDAWESRFGLDPKNPADAAGDLDGDGYTNIEEYLNATDPTKSGA